MASRVRPELRERAARMLAEGRSTDEVGQQIGVRGSTVRAWRRNDAEFRRLLAQYEGGMYARGLLLAAERGVRITVRSKPDTGAADLVRGVLVEMGRKDARRTDGGIFNNLEES